MDQKENNKQSEEFKDQAVQDELDNETGFDNEDPLDEKTHGSKTEGLPEPSESELEKTQEELAELKDKYLRLYSEFDNFRRRTAKEKLELVKTANEDLVSALLPVLDDFERAQNSMTMAQDISSVKEGVQLIYSKLFKILENKGVKPMDTGKGSAFNPELHDAITQIPASEESLKGKVVDVIEKGYYLGDKVVRFAKVVTGA